MDDFYDRLIMFKAKNALKWGDIGDLVEKNEATIRIAIKRKSLSTLERQQIENYLDLGNIGKVNEEQETYQKINTNDTIEERIAQSVAEKLLPQLERMHRMLLEIKKQAAK